jgi:hypothetical protein
MLSWASALLLLATPEPAAVFKMTDKSALALAVLSPPGAKPRLSYSELARTVESVASVHTDLAPVLLENVVVESCAGKLSCIARLATTGDSSGPVLLLVLSVLPGSDRDLFGAAVIDLGLFRRMATDLADDPAREDKLEAAVNERGLIAPEERRQIETQEDVQLFLEGLLEHAWRPGLERLGHWEPYGVIEVSTNQPEAVLRVDESSLGSAKEGLNRIERVRGGSRKLSLQLADFPPFEQTIDVKPGSTTVVEASFQSRVGTNSAARTVVFWTGIGSAAIGGALLIVRETSVREAYVCVPAAGCDGDAFEARGLLAIGTGLAAGGATMALTTLLFGDDSTLPWLQVALGIGIGVLAGVVTTAL